MIENLKRSKSWDELTFADNFLFCKILESEPELCRQLLELLLHIRIDHLEVPQAERTMQETIESKSVRFDVYTKDDNRIFDLEMQTTDTKNLPKRARYYQSIIDMTKLNDGAVKVFFNAAECDKLKTKEERDFFHFLKGETVETGFSRNIREKVEFAKKNMAWRR